MLAGALRDGRANLDQARVIAAALAKLPGEVSSEVVDQAEAVLVEYIDRFDPTELGRLGRRILDVIAPEIAEAAEARRLADLEASARRRMRLRLRASVTTRSRPASRSTAATPGQPRPRRLPRPHHR